MTAELLFWLCYGGLTVSLASIVVEELRKRNRRGRPYDWARDGE